MQIIPEDIECQHDSEKWSWIDSQYVCSCGKRMNAKDVQIVYRKEHVPIPNEGEKKT